MNGIAAIRPFIPPTLPVEPVPLRGPAPGAPAGLPADRVAGPSESFDNVLGGLVKEVNAKQMAAGEMVNGLLTGQNVSLHQAVIAMEEAGLSFQFMVEVRNKLLEAYQELMRMHV